MRLNEISVPKTKELAGDVLKKAGYSLLGTGKYASVYHKQGTNYVLKLFDEHDNAYLAYLDLIKNNSNIHFPKILSKPILVSGNYYAVKMEKLEPFNDENNFVRTLNDYIVKRRDTWDGLSCDWSKVYNKINHEGSELKEACDLVAKLLLNNRNFFSDIWESNIMLRGSVIVLTDPVAQI